MNGHLIRKYRESANIKRLWLAEQLGINESTLHRIEKNEIPLTVERLYQIAQLLKISILDLFDEKHLRRPETDEAGKPDIPGSSFTRFVMYQNQLINKRIAELIDLNNNLTGICNKQQEQIRMLVSGYSIIKANNISKTG